MDKNIDTDKYAGMSLDDMFAQNEQPETVSEVEGQHGSDISDDSSPIEEVEELESSSNLEETAEDIAAANQSDSSELSDNPLENMPDSDTLDIEEVFVKGNEGRKQKVKINYSDKKAIKNAFVKAAGMRKFQLERDQEKQNHLATKKEYEALKTDLNKLEEAYEQSGIKGIVNLLGGEEDAWGSAIDEEMKHREYLANLTAEEKYALEMKKRDEKYQRELASERQQREQFQAQINAEKEAAEDRAFQSKIMPAFDRYRFAGKLGDPESENLLDESLFDRVKARLAEYPEDVELTQSIIDKEFRTVANRFNKTVKRQTEKKVSKTIEKKKQETAQRARVAAKKGLSKNSVKDQVLNSLKSGGGFGAALDLLNSNRK